MKERTCKRLTGADKATLIVAAVCLILGTVIITLILSQSCQRQLLHPIEQVHITYKN